MDSAKREPKLTHSKQNCRFLISKQPEVLRWRDLYRPPRRPRLRRQCGRSRPNLGLVPQSRLLGRAFAQRHCRPGRGGVRGQAGVARPVGRSPDAASVQSCAYLDQYFLSVQLRCVRSDDLDSLPPVFRNSHSKYRPQVFGDQFTHFESTSGERKKSSYSEQNFPNSLTVAGATVGGKLKSGGR